MLERCSTAFHRVRGAVSQLLSQVSLLPPTHLGRSGAAPKVAQHHVRREHALAPGCSLQVVSQRPLVLVAHGFLGADDCASIVSVAMNQRIGGAGGANKDPKVRHGDRIRLPPFPLVHQHAGMPTGATDAIRGMDGDDSALLESVYGRIDALCGAPRWDGESSPPKVHFYGGCSGGDLPLPHTRAGERMPLGLHVDVNASPFRFATAILYLSTLPQPCGDGATVFPCAADVASRSGSQDGCGSGGGNGDCTALAQSNAARKAGATLLARNVVHTDMVLAHRSGGVQPREGEGGVGDRDTGSTQAHAAALVRAASQRGCAKKGTEGAGGGGLSVYPEAGKLVLFFTCDSDGDVDPCSWHGGAAVGDVTGSAPAATDSEGRGADNGKWMLQIFKDVPPGARGRVAKARFVSASRKQALSFTTGAKCSV